MFKIYSDETVQSLYIANSRYGLNQCIDALEKQGISVSYKTHGIDCTILNGLTPVPHWKEV